MPNITYQWFDASKRHPKPTEYNKDGYVIVAYEDGTVTRGYVFNNEWSFKNLHGRALYWTPFPTHPKLEEIKHLVV